MKKPFERYHAAVAYIEGLSNIPTKIDYMTGSSKPSIHLDRMRDFLSLIGNPEHGFKYLHITGTAGKGSVTNALHSVLHASGAVVGSYTSPFCTTSIEKIKVGDEYIDPEVFADIVEYLKPFIDVAYLKSEYGRPSYFEIFLAISLLYFQQKRCEWVVLEVGCGGRYDATNVIPSPVCAVVTNIDYDHTRILGKTLKKIAHDKAGIIKTGCAFFTAEQRPALKKIFSEVCHTLNVPMKTIPPQVSYREYNHLLVTAVATHVGCAESALARGLSQAKLPCRFEEMSNSPTIILDGAHNRSKIRSVINNLSTRTYQKLHLVLGLADNKDDTKILPELIPLADSLYVTRFQVSGRHCQSPKSLSEHIVLYQKPDASQYTFLCPHNALEAAVRAASSRDLILVTGSFYLAGELRQRWYGEDWILRHRRSFK